MTFNKSTATVALTCLIFSASAAFAQVGGGDIPKDAKKQGSMQKEGGAMSKDGMAKDGMAKDGMTKDGMAKSGGMEKKGSDKM